MLPFHSFPFFVFEILIGIRRGNQGFGGGGANEPVFFKSTDGDFAGGSI